MTRSQRTGRAMAVVMTLSLAAGCGQAGKGEDPSPSAEEAAPSATTAGYAGTPELTSASRTAEGVVLVGRSAPGARVTLASPTGWRAETVADRTGAWRLVAPTTAEPSLYALSAVLGGRTVRAEGAVAILPAPGPAALLARAGYAALPLPVRTTLPLIFTVDFDAGGAAAVAGSVAPNARVQLSVDGQAVDVDIADRQGRFALLGPKTGPLAAGPHVMEVQSPQGSTERRVSLSPPAPLRGAVVRSARLADGWRLDWAIPGGGVQSTLALDPGA